MLALILALTLASTTQGWADGPYHHGNYRHDAHGYWDNHHAYRHYAYWHNYRGYWGNENGVQVFFILD